MLATDANGELIISSTGNGKISSLSVTEGQMVSPGDILAQIIPESSENRYVVMWVPNDSVPFIEIGNPVNVRYEAFPFQKYGQFTGRIISISHVPAPLKEMQQYSYSPIGQAANTYYKVMVSMDANAITALQHYSITEKKVSAFKWYAHAKHPFFRNASHLSMVIFTLLRCQEDHLGA